MEVKNNNLCAFPIKMEVIATSMIERELGVVAFIVWMGPDAALQYATLV